MKIVKDIPKTLQFDPERCDKVYEDLVKVLQKGRPTTGELIILLGNLLYTCGASIGKWPEKGPSFDELQRLYYSEPGRLDLAMMLQGLAMTQWYEEWAKLQLSKDTKEES